MSAELLRSAVRASMESLVPASNYTSDCFVTSEAGYNDVLSKRLPAGDTTTGAYLGVGPCQNLIYSGALRPRLALVVDARIDNVLEHLIFKLLMERAPTPLHYLGLLFAREAHDCVPAPQTSPEALIGAFESLPASPRLQLSTVHWIKAEMVRRWALPHEYFARVDHIYGEFFERQLDITSVDAKLLANLDFLPTLREVILARTTHGINLHFLTDPKRYAYVRRMQLDDRIIPLLGNLLSAQTVEQVNGTLREAGEALSHVYLSNLEEFLLGRYVLDSERISQRPNPAGMLSGHYGEVYRTLLTRLSELDTHEDAALIRFFFPATVGGYEFGRFPYLEGDIRSLGGFLDRWCDRLPASVLHTYF